MYKLNKLLFLYFPIEPDELLIAELAVPITVVHLDQLTCFLLVKAELTLQDLVCLHVRYETITVLVVLGKCLLYIIHDLGRSN